MKFSGPMHVVQYEGIPRQPLSMPALVQAGISFPALTQPKSKCLGFFQPFQLFPQGASEALMENLLPRALRGTPPPAGVRVQFSLAHLGQLRAFYSPLQVRRYP